MKATTEQVITAVITGDETIADKGVLQEVLNLLSGRTTENRFADATPMDRVVGRQEVQQLFGFKSPKSVDQYARKGILERVTLPGNSRASGFSESSVRRALASRAAAIAA